MGATIAEILLEQGRHAAESRRARAGAWQPFLQSVAQIPGQVMADRRESADRRLALEDREQARQARAIQMQAGQQQVAAGEREAASAEASAADEAALTEIFATPGILDEGGAVDLRKATQLAQQRAPRLVPRLMKAAQEHDEVVQKAALTAAQTAAAERSNQPQGYTLNPGDKRFAPGGALEAEVPAEEKPDTRALNVQLADAIRRGDRQGMNAIRQAMRDAEQLGRAPETPSFQAKEVLNDAGQAVMANYDARTGRYTDNTTGQPIKNPRPVPSAAETQDARKFKQAEPILSSVSELSEKINTNSGIIAKMRGGVEKAKAQANYNDDVAEYEALISGFTPLVARALGHTGVLTQQDVDSVKALFPRPGDSKSLRDRKIARIKSIIGELEAGAAVSGGGTPQAPTTATGRVYYDANGDPVSR